jgi:FkbM family methyltransferase
MMDFLRRLMTGQTGFGRKPRQAYRIQTVYLGDHTLLIRTRHGHKIYADSRDLSVVPTLVFKGHWEPWLTDVMARVLRPGMRVADVGAHIGYHTSVMAGLVGPKGYVHAVEANPRLAALLRKTISANGWNAYVRCHEVVVAEEAGEIDFHMMDGLMGSSSIIPMEKTALEYGDTVQAQRLRADRLDAIISVDRLDAMKIDCEGSEPAALAGARRLLESGSLKHIFMEYSRYFYRDRTRPQQMFAELAGLGFRAAIIQRTGALQPVACDRLHTLDNLHDLYLSRD